MEFCEKCGSTSRDKDGFCGGCGAPWPLEILAAEASPTSGNPASAPAKLLPPLKLQSRVGPIVLPDVRPRKVWLAIVLALLVGPLGLLYCTTTGTLVMLFVSMILWIKFGAASFLIVQPLCALWAWRAARELSSSLV
jgi:hypothetical protein